MTYLLDILKGIVLLSERELNSNEDQRRHFYMKLVHLSNFFQTFQNFYLSNKIRLYTAFHAVLN